jgi:hypothetical protein
VIIGGWGTIAVLRDEGLIVTAPQRGSYVLPRGDLATAMQDRSWDVGSLTTTFTILYLGQGSGTGDRVAPDPGGTAVWPAGTKGPSAMHPSGLPFAAATATFPPPDAPNPLPTRGPPASNGQAPADGGAVAAAELTRYLTEDHDRIAQSINDVVVRRIFTAGLDLHAALALIGDHRGASKIWHAIDELDQAVKDIRDIILIEGSRCPPLRVG